MKPFKMFFGLSVGIILFFFVAKVLFLAFIAAAVMSIIYAVYRRVKDFITYDRYGESYIPAYQYADEGYYRQRITEPLFYEQYSSRPASRHGIHFIEAK